MDQTSSSGRTEPRQQHQRLNKRKNTNNGKRNDSAQKILANETDFVERPLTYRKESASRWSLIERDARMQRLGKKAKTNASERTRRCSRRHRRRGRNCFIVDSIDAAPKVPNEFPRASAGLRPGFFFTAFCVGARCGKMAQSDPVVEGSPEPQTFSSSSSSSSSPSSSHSESNQDTPGRPSSRNSPPGKKHTVEWKKNQNRPVSRRKIR